MMAHRIGVVEAHDRLATHALLLCDSRLAEIEVHGLREAHHIRMECICGHGEKVRHSCLLPLMHPWDAS